MDSYKISCERIDELFMKHMDGLITVEERDEVLRHINECARCREDFEVYEAIMVTLDSQELVCEAPEGFEADVMQRISRLPNSFSPMLHAAYILMGMLVVSAGVLGTVFFEEIEHVLNRLEFSSRFVPILESTLDSFSVTLLNIGAEAGNVSVSLLEALAQAQFVLLFVFILLIMLQFVVYKYDKA